MYARWLQLAGGRRFVMTMGAGIVNTALFAVGIMTEGGYITLTLATVGAYLTANGVQRYQELKSD